MNYLLNIIVILIIIILLQQHLTNIKPFQNQDNRKRNNKNNNNNKKSNNKNLSKDIKEPFNNNSESNSQNDSENNSSNTRMSNNGNKKKYPKFESQYDRAEKYIKEIHNFGKIDGPLDKSLKDFKSSYEMDFKYDEDKNSFFVNNLENNNDIKIKRELIPAIKHHIDLKKQEFEESKLQGTEQDAAIQELEEMTNKLNHQIMTTVVDDYDPNQDKVIKSNSYGSIINHLDNVGQGDYIIRNNEKPEQCLYTSSYKNIPNNATKKCDTNDIAQKVNVYTVFQDSDYVQYLPKINNTTDLNKINNHSEFKYPFKIIKSKNNNQCLHNYDINKYKFTECIPNVAQQYRMWDKT